MEDLSTAYLKEKRKQLIEQLREIQPNLLRGSLIEKFRRCGKSNCRCAKERGHLSHYLSVSMPGIRPTMIYIPLTYKDSVQKALANYQEAQQIMEEISTINRTLLAQKEFL